jgi:hypothetical protein
VNAERLGWNAEEAAAAGSLFCCVVWRAYFGIYIVDGHALRYGQWALVQHRFAFRCLASPQEDEQ